MRCMNHSVHFYWLSVISCFFFMQQENAQYLGTATYLLCTGKSSTQWIFCCSLQQSFDAVVHSLLSAAFGFPMAIKWISVL